MSFLLGALSIIGLLIVGAYLYIGRQIRVWPGK